MSLLSIEKILSMDYRCTTDEAIRFARLVEAAVLEAQKQEPEVFMKGCDLYDDITEVVAKQLRYFDNVEKINGATTAKEVSDVFEGGIDRYRNDAVFHAKVCSLVAHLTQVIAAAEGKK